MGFCDFVSKENLGLLCISQWGGGAVALELLFLEQVMVIGKGSEVLLLSPNTNTKKVWPMPGIMGM